MPLYVSYHKGVFAISNSRDVTKLREEPSPKKINIASNSSLYADIDVKTLSQILSKGSMMASIVGSQLQMEKIKINTAGNNQGDVEITFNGNMNLYQVFSISK